MPAVHKGGRKDGGNDASHPTQTCEPSNLLQVQSHFLVEKNHEQGTACCHNGAGLGEIAQPIEAVGETFLSIVFETGDQSAFAPLLLLNRRILPFLDPQAHEADDDHVEQGHTGKNLPHVGLRILEDKHVEECSRRRADDAKKPHETADELRGHCVVEQAVENRAHEHVEEPEGEHEKAQENNCHGRRRKALQKPDIRMQPVRSFLTPTNHEQAGREKRQSEQNEGNPAAPATAQAVALVTDPRANGHVQNARQCAHDKPDRPIGSFQLLQLQREHSRDDHIHKHDAKVAPEQPSEERDECRLGVGQCACGETHKIISRGGCGTNS